MMISSARQQDNEPLAEYYKRNTSCVDVGESQWGTPVPTVAATNEMETSRDKLITYLFLQEWYGRWKTKLNNAYVAQQNKFPKKVENKQTKRVLCRSIRM
jgi:hypothetical protein